VKKCNDAQLIKDWEYLQTSDHFYYMCTKWFSDGDVHKYFNPYGTPYEAFINYMNVLSDFIIRVETCNRNTQKSKDPELPVNKTNDINEESKTSSSYGKFTDLTKIPKQKLRSILANFDAETLIYALQNVNANLKDKVLSNITNKALADFERLEDKITDFESNKIRNAKRKILNKIKSL